MKVLLGKKNILITQNLSYSLDLQAIINYSMSTVAILDLGIGNIKSVYNAIKVFNKDVVIVEDAKKLCDINPNKIILPGVGAVGEAIYELRKRNLEDCLNKMVLNKNVYFLGICLGMQILAEECNEFGKFRGLGWIKGKVNILKNVNNLKIPHVGWNSIKLLKNSRNILSDLNNKDFYFTHSFAMQCEKKYILAKTNYGYDFVSAVKYKNIYGVQFHPEKSSREGEVLFRNFMEL